MEAPVTEGRTVAVVGGGFAGVAAACRLAGDGLRPILLERAPRLGGRAASFRDRVSGEHVDYGHHVSMRCCTATHGFLQRIGASDALPYQPELAVPILCGPERSDLRSNLFLPGFLHLAPALLRYRCLSAVERFRVASAAIALPAARGEISFGDWLRRRRQSERSVARLWNPICVATLNAHADEVSLQAARHVFREGFFSRGGAGLGLFTRVLGDVFAAAWTYIEERGGQVRTGTGVARILTGSSRAVGVETSDGDAVEADSVIAAVPPWDLRAIVSDPLLAPILERAGRLAWAPIVDVHLWLDRPVLEEDFVIAVDGPVQAVFDLSRIHERPSAVGSHLVLSQSAAEPWIDRSSEEIVEELVGALRDLVPAAREARVTRHLVVRHRRATFVPAPGADALRPPSKTPVEGLYLAGDWTASGWPSTIEGAIRSGIAAAGRAETAQ